MPRKLNRPGNWGQHSSNWEETFLDKNPLEESRCWRGVIVEGVGGLGWRGGGGEGSSEWGKLPLKGGRMECQC